MSAFCREHEYRRHTTGHHTALDIKRRTWKPFVIEATRFVQEQTAAGHPSILAGIHWVADEITQAGRPDHQQTDLSAPAVRYREALVRAVRHGNGPADLLARWIAAYLSDDRGLDPGPRFASDQHFAVQSARVFLMPLPFGDQRGSWAKRKRVPQESTKNTRMYLAAYEAAFARINAALGLVALKAAEAIRARWQQQQQDDP